MVHAWHSRHRRHGLVLAAGADDTESQNESDHNYLPSKHKTSSATRGFQAHCRASIEQGTLREVDRGQILRTRKEAVLRSGGGRMGTCGVPAMRSGWDSITAGVGVAATRRLEPESWDIDQPFGPRSWNSWPQGAGVWSLGR